eukprot:TRINITY_DN35006_c0_g1_i1.p1 TRINITY_DN35006_c0_g1~~TRINITY_DN35006_c0_g1_i1.p1  ORF type:complete len:700 (+),score=80.02 TRINITY_DN35006_c0_g1_i1:641-2740(+)
MARMRAHRAPILPALAQAAEQHPRLNGKGYLIILEAFALLRFRSEGFLSCIGAWAASGGLGTCTDEQLIAMARALGTLGVRRADGTAGVVALAKPIAELLDKLSHHLSGCIDHLDPQALTALVFAVAKVRVADPPMVQRLETALHHELHRLHLAALPGLIDTMSQLYQACSESGSEFSPLTNPARREFIAHFSGRLTRQLWHLRPQDACRSLQALDRIGVVDPHLLAGVAQTVPAQLATWPPDMVASLLHAYAKAGNADGTMVVCLRRVLLPFVTSVTINAEGRSPPLVDPAPISRLSDTEVVRLAEDFIILGSTAGVLAMTTVLRRTSNVFAGKSTDDSSETSHSRPPLSNSCDLALAASVVATFPSTEIWEAARASLARAESSAVSRGDVAFKTAFDSGLLSSWQRRADVAEVDADTLLFAFSGFPRHTARAEFAAKLSQRADECTLSLLPGALLAADADDANSELATALERSLMRRLTMTTCGKTLSSPMPPAAAVAALRVLARRYGTHDPLSRVPIIDASRVLVGGLLVSTPRSVQETTGLPSPANATSDADSVAGDARDADAPDDIVPTPTAKQFVRALQALQQMDMDPPALLVQRFAETSPALTPGEFLTAMRLLPARVTSRDVGAIQTSVPLAAMATRAIKQLRSSRQAWELQSLCRRLGLDVGEVEAMSEDPPAGYEEAHGQAVHAGSPQL